MTLQDAMKEWDDAKLIAERQRYADLLALEGITPAQRIELEQGMQWMANEMKERRHKANREIAAEIEAGMWKKGP